MEDKRLSNKRALFISFFITTAYMIIELFGGILTNSLALISDSGHMFSDCVSMAISIVAMRVGERGATDTKTYGYKRVEILAALINGITLIAIAIYIFIEGYKRIVHPPEVATVGMLIIATIGLIINIISAYNLSRSDTKNNVNIRSVYLHVLGDMLGSVGAIVAAIIMMTLGWRLADPIASILVSILVLVSGIRVTKDTLHILMEGKPDNIAYEDVSSKLLSISHVEEVHDLHIWSITNEVPVLTCHIIISKNSNRDEILDQIHILLKNSFNIEHATIQIESKGHDEYIHQHVEH